MKNTIAIMTGLLVLSVSGLAAAEKIGFVDVREVMVNTEIGKKANEDLKKIYDKNKVLIQSNEAELQKMKESLDKQRSILTESALKEKEAAYHKKFADYQSLVREANANLQAKDQEYSKQVIPEIQKIIIAIGEKEKYTAIFDTSAIPVPFFSKGADLTKRVTEEFNKTVKPKK